MDKKTLTIIIFSLLVTATLIGLWRWHTSPARQIKKTLETMAELGSSPLGESTIAKALKTQRLVEYFSEEATIEWPGDETISAGRWVGRGQISQQVLAAKNSVAYEVSLVDLAINSERRDPEATAKFTLVAKEETGVRSDTRVWLAEALFLKEGRHWRVTQLIFRPTLRR